MHAYRGSVPSGEMRVRVEFMTLHDFAVTVEDDGCGLAPRADSPGVGLGLSLIGTLADRVQIAETPTGGTRVSMFFCTDASGTTNL